MDNAMSARTQLNEVSPVKISFNDLIVKAAALALRQHPAVNASWMPARAGTDGLYFLLDAWLSLLCLPGVRYGSGNWLLFPFYLLYIFGITCNLPWSVGAFGG